MKHYAFDSSFIINFLSGDERAAEFYHGLKAKRLAVPAPVKLETLRGVKSLEVFEKLEKPGFKDEEASEALKLLEFLEEEGEMIGIMDLMIASIAATNSLTVISYDQDFSKLEGYDGFEYELVQSG